MIPHRQTLIAMGWPQPKIPIQTDNSTAVGVTNKTRLEARDTFIKHIDDVLSADYGSDLYISHRCVRKDKNEESKIEIADDMLKEKKEVDFRRARHKELCKKINRSTMSEGMSEGMRTADNRVSGSWPR